MNLALLAVAILLRLPDVAGRSTYAAYERVRDLGIVEAMAHGRFPLIGPPSSLGDFHFGPVYYYLLYPLAALARFEPYALALTASVASIATIALAYHVVHAWWHDRTLAFGVAAMMTISILDVQLAKYASNPNFIPFFALVFFFSLERIFREPAKRWPWYALGGAFAVATQLHAVPLLALPLVLVVALARKNVRPTAADTTRFLAPVILLYAPYAANEYAQGFSNIANLWKFTGHPFDLSYYLAHWVQYAGFLVSPWISIHPFFDIASLWGRGFMAAMTALSLGTYLAFRHDLHHSAPTVIPAQAGIQTTPSVKTTLILWFAAPTFVLLAPISGPDDFPYYYFLSLSPLIYIAYAFGIRMLWRKGWHATVRTLIAAFVLLQCAQLVQYGLLVRNLSA